MTISLLIDLFYRGGRGDAYQRVARIVTFIWKHTFARIGEDWVFLGLLGVIMALVSFLMDYTISMCNNARLWLVKDLVSNIYLQFVAWVLLTFSQVKIIKICHILVTRNTLSSCYRTQSKYFTNASGFSPSLPRLVLDWFRACSSPSGNLVRIDDIIIK